MPGVSKEVICRALYRSTSNALSGLESKNVFKKRLKLSMPVSETRKLSGERSLPSGHTHRESMTTVSDDEKMTTAAAEQRCCMV